MLSGRYSQAKQVADSLNPVPGVVLADDEQKKWELGVDGFWSTLLSPSLNFFHREVKNEKSVSGFSWTGNVCKTTGVSTTAVLTPCYTQSDTTREGVELAVNGAFMERSSYRASVTHFTSLSTNVEKTTPVDIVDVSVSHGMGRYTLTGAVKQVSAYRGSATDVNAYLGGYTRVDLGLGYDFRVSGTPVKATLYGRNLTDQHYETNNGVQDVGRVLGLELMASF
jgi:outer membrane receptor protein involved in Fe transport